MRMFVLALFVLGASAGCSSQSSCGECTNEANWYQDGDNACYWCFDLSAADQGTCLSVGYITLSTLTGGSALYDACPSIENVAQTQAMCDCNPAVYDTCEKCANISNPNCVWVEAGTEESLNVQYSYASDGVTTSAYANLATWQLTEGSCRNGDATGPYNDVGVVITDEASTWVVYMYKSIVPSNWYWIQCNIPGVGMLATVVICPTMFVCVLCLVLAVICRRCRRARATRHLEMEKGLAGGPVRGYAITPVP